MVDHQSNGSGDSNATHLQEATTDPEPTSSSSSSAVAGSQTVALCSAGAQRSSRARTNSRACVARRGARRQLVELIRQGAVERALQFAQA